MNWSVLPVAGGLYDQHPLLLDRFMYIFQQRAEFEERKRAREKLQQQRTARKGGSRGR